MSESKPSEPQLHNTEHSPEKEHEKESWGEWAREKVGVLKEKAIDLVDATRETVHNLTEKKDDMDQEDLDRDSSELPSREVHEDDTKRVAGNVKAGGTGTAAHQLKGDQKFISKDTSGGMASKDIGGGMASKDIGGGMASKDIGGGMASKDTSGRMASKDTSGGMASKDIGGGMTSEGSSSSAGGGASFSGRQDMKLQFSSPSDVTHKDSQPRVSQKDLERTTDPSSNKDLPASALHHPNKSPKGVVQHPKNEGTKLGLQSSSEVGSSHLSDEVKKMDLKGDQKDDIESKQQTHLPSKDISVQKNPDPKLNQNLEGQVTKGLGHGDIGREQPAQQRISP